MMMSIDLLKPAADFVLIDSKHSNALWNMKFYTWLKCSPARRYKSLALNIFGHTESHHQLITPAERAKTYFGVKPGSKVTFTFEGRQIVGIVNAVRRRATVLVPSPRGTLYSDGYRYEKFYVAVDQLKPI
jgi:hypothetical protein